MVSRTCTPPRVPDKKRATKPWLLTVFLHSGHSVSHRATGTEKNPHLLVLPAPQIAATVDGALELWAWPE